MQISQYLSATKFPRYSDEIPAFKALLVFIEFTTSSTENITPVCSAILPRLLNVLTNVFVQRYSRSFSPSDKIYAYGSAASERTVSNFCYILVKPL